VHAPAGTGTWNGAAPRGYLGGKSPEQVAAQKAAAAQAVQEPEFVRLSNGAKMPMVGYGTFKVDEAAVKAALAAGYRHLDCAAVYGTEAVVGAAIKASGVPRDQLFITSKLWNEEHRPERVRAACEKSLADLGCGHLDLYLVHWPDAWVPGGKNDFGGSVEVDATVSLLDTWRAMEGLVDAGLVKAIGVSNFSLAQVEAVLAGARVKPVVNQVELHPLLAQRKLTGVCFRKGVQCVGYSPLGGLGAGGVPNPLLGHEVVGRIAAQCGRSPAQVLLKWNMQRGVPVIPRSATPANIAANIEGAFTWKLTNEQKAVLDALDCGLRTISPAWHDWGNIEDGGVLKPTRVIAGEVAPPPTAA